MSAPAERPVLSAFVVSGLAALVACSSAGSGSGDGSSGGASGSGDTGSESAGSGGSSSSNGSGGTSGSPSGGSSGSGSSSGGGSSGSAGSGSGSGSAGASGADSGAGEGGSKADGGGSSGGCLGASLLSDLGKTKMIVGGAVADATASSTPLDLRYLYLSGGLFDSSTACTSCTSCSSGGTSCANESGGGCAWWGCWQYDKDPPGETARNLISGGDKASPVQIPMYTYYEILSATGNNQGQGEVNGASQVSVMTRYFADWRFLLQQIGQSVAILHIEPDFWGFAEEQNANAHSLPAAVASANATDCAGVENSIAGMGQCMISMVRKYAPHAKVGIHASAWASGMDVAYNSNASLDVAAQAKTLATFLTACGADKGDFVAIETSDRDAGYYASMGQNRSWDVTNKTLPDFTQDLTWAKAITEDLGVPALYWQTPLGNSSQNNTTDHWTDNRVDYFFAHMGDLAAAHVIGVAYGAGAAGQTTPESDGGNFIAKVKAYQQAGGQTFCP